MKRSLVVTTVILGTFVSTPGYTHPCQSDIGGPYVTMGTGGIGNRGYRFFRIKEMGDVRWNLVLREPTNDDPNRYLAVAGTSTSPTGKPEGFIMVDGEVKQRKPKPWDGALVITLGHVEIIRTAAGKAINDLFVQQLGSAKSSVIQGHLLVYAGKPQSFRPGKTLRRAIVRYWEGQMSIVESTEPIDLTTFAADLADNRIAYALNLDMGNWSNGWSREFHPPGSSNALGCFRNCETRPRRETNWLVLDVRK